ncbi:unnamed protein product [Porites lobata]|uniref:Spaetzle domain-containing protein n=1 Tax=Porites lobata TaxID=104759 RepID=A0ABN8NX72_9CNID|nr:unnamed protein product [Porites lobata]
MSSLKFCLLFSVCWCLLTHMTAGAPSSYEFQSVEGYVVPPSESSNGTTGTGTHDIKRFLRQLPQMRACQEIYSRLDPKQYFKTKDIFIPRFVNTIECAGTPSNPPTCGPANGFMRCLTRFGRVEFVRMPRHPLMCRRQRRVVIPNIPVGCYCV